MLIMKKRWVLDEQQIRIVKSMMKKRWVLDEQQIRIATKKNKKKKLSPPLVHRLRDSQSSLTRFTIKPKIFLMTAVSRVYSVFAFSNSVFGTLTSKIVQKDWGIRENVLSLEKHIVENHSSFDVTQLPAKHVSSFLPRLVALTISTLQPSVITDCSPLSFEENLNPTGCGGD